MIDPLIERIRKLHAPVAVGLDPTEQLVPEKFLTGGIPQGFLRFNMEIIDAVHDLVPAVKPQIAMYERYGAEGVRAYIDTCRYARQKGLFVIGDIKRGDIASTAAAYAAHLEEALWHTDAVTLNPYMGYDSAAPFLEICARAEKMVFILVKTSNKSSADLQEQPLQSGKKVFEHMADLVSGWGRNLIGQNGYSKAGAVVGATFPEEGAALRTRMPHSFFLVPGYGAQGASAEDLRGFFDKNGEGCIINSSRGITGAWRESKTAPGEAARGAVLEMVENLGAVKRR